MEVGIRELKSRLSSYVRRASGGDLITVTDHGKPVAVLGPVPGVVDLGEAVAQGWVTPATRRGLRPVQRYQGTGSVVRSLDEDRAE